MPVSDQRGFTIVELLVTMTIGLVVLTAAGQLMVVTKASTARIEGRVDASQRGRVAMEQMTQQLRAAVCLPDPTPPVDTETPPYVAASPDSVTFYADLDSNTTYNQEQRRLTAQRDANGNVTSIVEERWVGIAPPSAGSPTRTRTLITSIRSMRDAGGNPVPVFRYYGYANSAAITPTQLASTVGGADLQRITRIDIAFRSLPSTRFDTEGRQQVDMQSSVYARTVRRDNGGNQPTFDCTG